MPLESELGVIFPIKRVHPHCSCTEVSFYPSLSCSLGPDWGTLIHALWTFLILYIVKWKQEKHPCFPWQHALNGATSFRLGSQCLWSAAVSPLVLHPAQKIGISLGCASQGSVKWLSACQDLFWSQCLQRTSFTRQLAKQMYKEQKDNTCLKNKFWGDQVQVGNYINQL